jgi:hypothetical protein
LEGFRSVLNCDVIGFGMFCNFPIAFEAIEQCLIVEGSNLRRSEPPSVLDKCRYNSLHPKATANESHHPPFCSNDWDAVGPRVAVSNTRPNAGVADRLELPSN